MTKTKCVAPAANNEMYDPCESKPYNRYNIYYILERERFLQSNSNYKHKTTSARSSNFVTGYECLELPDLPPRYANLDLPFDWYMPGKRKGAKRDHKKSHGLASFRDIARFVADGYKNIDDVTLEYVTAVATILKQRHKELKATRRRRGFLTAVKLTSSPSNHDTTCDESAHHYPTHPGHTLWASPQMSGLFINSSVAVDAAAPCCTFRTKPGEVYSINCVDATRVIPIPTSISEVDIDDGDIMAMWHYN